MNLCDHHSFAHGVGPNDLPCRAPGARYKLARTGETVQLIRPVTDTGGWHGHGWLCSVVFPYSAQRDLITCPCEWLSVELEEPAPAPDRPRDEYEQGRYGAGALGAGGGYFGGHAD